MREQSSHHCQAGLFSTILTAFVAQTYQNLQENPAESTNNLLLHISQQLADSSTPPAKPPNFSVAHFDLVVNILWFISLVLSLATALFGIFVKQWLRSYMSWTDIGNGHAALTVREYRDHSLRQWRFHEIILLLPVLLQIALVLFGVGLVQFCFHLNKTLGTILFAVSSICLLAIIATTVLPFFSPQSPYRSPWSVHLAQARLYFSALKDRLFDLVAQIIIDSAGMPSLTQYSTTQRYSALSAARTWNQVDQNDLKSLKWLTGAVDTEPSWEARSLAARISTEQDMDVLKGALHCIFRRKSEDDNANGTWSLNIADCWHIAGSFFDLQSSTDLERKLSHNDLAPYIEEIPDLFRPQLFSLLLQGLTTWARMTPEAAAPLNPYGRQCCAMLRCLWHEHVSKEDNTKQTLVRYVGILAFMEHLSPVSIAIPDIMGYFEFMSERINLLDNLLAIHSQSTLRPLDFLSYLSITGKANVATMYISMQPSD
jgi:hypothetical protein